MLQLRVFALAILLAPAMPAYSQILCLRPLQRWRMSIQASITPDASRSASGISPQVGVLPHRTATGTIIVNTSDRYLYLIMGNGVAMRYGVGVGRDGFQWGGIQKITVKREWPDWVHRRK